MEESRKNVLGIYVDAVDSGTATRRIIDAAHGCRPYAVSALAVHGVMTGALDSEHRHRLNHLDLIVPDGQPVRWALNLLHRAGLADRVYGPNLMLSTCERAAAEELPIFLFGGTASVLETLSRNLRQRFPGLKIAGSRPSRFRKLSLQERDELIEEIRESGARLTYVGIGCPRQEVWAYEFRESLSMPILAVGAAFNFHAGLLQQAPPLLQRYGLEWAYRLGKEPGRLWKRYLYLNPLYLTFLTAQVVGLGKFDPELTEPPGEHLLYG